MPIRIAIADDHPLIATGICRLLECDDEITVTHIYHTGQLLLDGLNKEQPNVLLLDIALPDISGNELVRIVSAKYPKMKILAHTSIDTPFHIKDMMRHGCSGFLSKGANPDLLIEAIKEVCNGKIFLEPALKEKMMNSVFKIVKNIELTKREQQILELICAGHTNNEIAEQLFVNIRTVENHRFSLYHKFGVKNTAGLVKIAIQEGWIN